MENIRDKFKTFIYDSFSITEKEQYIDIEYIYKISDYIFKPHVTINKDDISNKDINWSFFEYLIFNFGIINSINYYKLTCSKDFVINCGYLEEEQKEFFKKLFYNGLGELLYINQLNINYDDFMNIKTIPGIVQRFEDKAEYIGNLIPIGGGKDSIVTLEALSKEKNINKCLLYKRNIYPDDLASLNTIKTAGYDDSAITSFNVTLDPLMLELNKKGFYNGHVPFSSCLAFAAYIMAYLNKKKYIVLSNEASANEGNIKGSNVNHQYSKSFEFEKDFRNYTVKYFGPQIEYFSLLRCWNEFQIIKKFLSHPQYLSVFRSCNIGSKDNKWCGSCSKCLYVFIMLYPFVEENVLIEIFGYNMLDDMKYQNYFLGLINPNYDKPFECVGTKEEIDYALKLSVEKNGGKNLPALLELYKNTYYDATKIYNIEDYFNEENFIDEKFLQMLGYDEDER